MPRNYVSSTEAGLPLPFGGLGDELALGYAQTTEMLPEGEGGQAALPEPEYLQSREQSLRELQEAARAVGFLEQARANLAQGPGSVQPYIPPPTPMEDAYRALPIAASYGPQDAYYGERRSVASLKHRTAPSPGPSSTAYEPLHAVSKGPSSFDPVGGAYGGSVTPRRQPFDATSGAPIGYSSPSASTAGPVGGAYQRQMYREKGLSDAERWMVHAQQASFSPPGVVRTQVRPYGLQPPTPASELATFRRPEKRPDETWAEYNRRVRSLLSSVESIDPKAY